MIESWLEENYGDVFTEEEIQSRAQIMDMSLIEQKKEANMKTIFEINSVVRMSLIEMQFIKKVRAMTTRVLSLLVTTAHPLTTLFDCHRNS